MFNNGLGQRRLYAEDTDFWLIIIGVIYMQRGKASQIRLVRPDLLT